MRHSNSRKLKSVKQDNLPPCEGFVPLPKWGNHPVMDLSDKANIDNPEPNISAASHIPDEFLQTTNSSLETTLEDNTMQVQNQAQAQNTNPTETDSTVGVNMEQSQAQNSQAVLTEEDTGFVTWGKTDKPHWAVVATAGAVVGAVTNYDQSLTTMAVGVVVAGGAAAATSHFVEDYSLAAAAAAALMGGLATRFLAPTVVGKLNPGSDNNVVMEEEVEALVM